MFVISLEISFLGFSNVVKHSTGFPSINFIAAISSSSSFTALRPVVSVSITTKLSNFKSDVLEVIEVVLKFMMSFNACLHTGVVDNSISL